MGKTPLGKHPTWGVFRKKGARRACPQWRPFVRASTWLGAGRFASSVALLRTRCPTRHDLRRRSEGRERGLDGCKAATLPSQYGSCNIRRIILKVSEWVSLSPSLQPRPAPPRRVTAQNTRRPRLAWLSTLEINPPRSHLKRTKRGVVRRATPCTLMATRARPERSIKRLL